MTIRRILGIASLLFLGWIATMALVMRFSDAAPAAVVILPDRAFIDALPEGAVLGSNRLSVTLKNDREGFARTLYQAGALLVLPAGLTGCLPLPKTFKT